MEIIGMKYNLIPIDTKYRKKVKLLYGFQKESKFSNNQYFAYSDLREIWSKKPQKGAK
jgi:hypothetical protein